MNGSVDVIVWGKLFIVNLDLLCCFEIGVLFNKLVLEMFYVEGEMGYIDYLVLSDVV